MVETAGFHGGKQVHGLHHMETRFLMLAGGEKNHMQKIIVLAFLN